MQTYDFDLISGLPVHPLIDHVVVVFVPLFALLQILIVFRPSLRPSFGLVTLVGLAVSTVSALIAEKSGEALADRVGNPGEHAEAGEQVLKVVAALFIVSAIWWYLESRSSADSKFRKQLVSLTGKLSALLALGAMVVTFQAGHSGAEATWLNRVNADAAMAGVTPGATAISGESIVLTAQEVALHSTSQDCWSIVNGSVYNLTSYVNSHPGGAANIQSICGKDGSSAFKTQHGTQGTPNNVLSNLLIGKLGATISGTAASEVTAPATGTGSEEGEENEEGEEGDD
jgi:cytochrome b involved in lipid metabolism